MISSPILNMFGRSPIKPLEQHMTKAYKCVKGLLSFFEYAGQEQWQQASDQRDVIATIEKEADSIKKDLRLHMPKGLFLPVPRTDILEILSMQDRIANRAKDIAGLVLGRHLKIPTALTNFYMQYLQRCIDATAQAHTAINELDELLETGFRGNEVKLVEQMIVELDRIEHDTDEMQIEIRKQLFAFEKEMSAIDAMFLYKLFEWTGDLADRSQAVGGQLLLLLAR